MLLFQTFVGFGKLHSKECFFSKILWLPLTSMLLFPSVKRVGCSGIDILPVKQSHNRAKSPFTHYIVTIEDTIYIPSKVLIKYYIIICGIYYLPNPNFSAIQPIPFHSLTDLMTNRWFWILIVSPAYIFYMKSIPWKLQ